VHPFKGDVDLEALERVLGDNPGKVPFAMITVTNNGGGGQPVSMANVRAAAAICRRHRVRFYFDACRFAENAYFIQQREEGFAGRPLIEIAREMFSYADGCTMSAKKDGMANIGGFLCSNDGAVARHEEELLILTKAFRPTAASPAATSRPSPSASTKPWIRTISSTVKRRSATSASTSPPRR
jgi:tryptophanase